MPDRPPLSVVITVRDGLDEVAPVFDALLPQARETGTEVVVVGRVHGAAPEGPRLVPVETSDIYRLRLIGIEQASGAVIAMGEDHAVPRPGWCAAVIRAHAEHPDAPSVCGCLVNGTDRTLSGRSNFLAFAAPYEPPMPAMPPLRPPPISALSFKRGALEGLDGTLGQFESVLVPHLFAEGRMVPDDRIVAAHLQDHGLRWAVRNGFHGARASYGYQRPAIGWRRRLYTARWSLVNWPRRLVREARHATSGKRGHGREVLVVAAIGSAVGLGAAAGALAGPGRSPDLVA